MTMDRLSQIILGAEALRSVPTVDRFDAYNALPEAARIAIVQSAGVVPVVCGTEAPVAPARGPARTVDFMASYPKGETSEVKPAGYAGRKTVVMLDSIEVMRLQVRRRGGTFALSDEQLGMARLYHTLVQTLEAGAVRCVNLEGQTGGGGSREGFTDHRLDLHRRVDGLRARIGNGVAMEVRRIRPSARAGDGMKRANIPNRALVDLVCLYDLTISEVLGRYGWSVKGDTVKAAMRALAAALDRMLGPVDPAVCSFRSAHDVLIFPEDGA